MLKLREINSNKAKHKLSQNLGT